MIEYMCSQNWTAWQENYLTTAPSATSVEQLAPPSSVALQSFCSAKDNGIRHSGPWQRTCYDSPGGSLDSVKSDHQVWLTTKHERISLSKITYPTIQPCSSRKLSQSLLHTIYHLGTKATFLHKYEELVQYYNSVSSPAWCRLLPILPQICFSLLLICSLLKLHKAWEKNICDISTQLSTGAKHLRLHILRWLRARLCLEALTRMGLTRATHQALNFQWIYTVHTHIIM